MSAVPLDRRGEFPVRFIENTAAGKASGFKEISSQYTPMAGIIASFSRLYVYLS